MARLKPLKKQEISEPGDLLHDLLQAPIAAEREPYRPARLRTIAEQHQVALSPFLLRTWLDKVLLVAERGLAVGAVAVFGFWLADGPGRDMLHSWQQTELNQVAVLPTATVREFAPLAPISIPALPYTTPDMAQPTRSEPVGADFLAPQTFVAPAPIADQRPRRLAIARIGLDTPVTEVFVEGASWQVADYAAGYHHGTALPGSPGNTVMAGHAGLRGAVFRDLPALTSGDEVVIETGDWRYHYRVREVKSVWPTQVEVMDPTPTPILTLITCTNWDTQRLVVVADLVDARPLS